MRGIWVDAFGEGIRTPAETAELIEFAGASGLDALVVQVTRRGDAFANALPLPRADADLAARPFDPLAHLCDAAHAAGLAVHAWVSATPIAQGRPPAARYEPWLSRRADGADQDLHGIAHLDPGHPEARAFVAECAASVAARYPVDGVNLDRVRYPEAAGTAGWGYNPTALGRYAAEHGRREPPASADAAWQAWRRVQVTALVDETAAAVRAVRSDVAVSTTACCFGGLERGWEASRPHSELGQDWVGWLCAQRVDRVLVMNYRGDADDRDLVPHALEHADLGAEGAVAAVADPSALRARFDAWARTAVAAGGDRAVLGTGLYLHDAAANAAEAAHALAFAVEGRRAGGWCGYSYRTPSRAVLHGRRAASEERAALARQLERVVA